MGLAAALAARYVGRKTPAYRLYWSPLGAVCGLAIGIAVGLITGRAAGLSAGLLAGIAVGLLSSVPCGLSGRIRQDQDKDKSTVLNPRKALSHDYRTFWKTAPTAGIAGAIAGLLGGGLASINAINARPDLSNIISNGLWIGLAAGIIIGLGFGLHHASSVFFVITSYWLALRRRLPWQLMSFLADAHQEREILRQSGSVYQFRHLALLHWLAAADSDRAPRCREQDMSLTRTSGAS